MIGKGMGEEFACNVDDCSDQQLGGHSTWWEGNWGLKKSPLLPLLRNSHFKSSFGKYCALVIRFSCSRGLGCRAEEEDCAHWTSCRGTPSIRIIGYYWGKLSVRCLIHVLLRCTRNRAVSPPTCIALLLRVCILCCCSVILATRDLWNFFPMFLGATMTLATTTMRPEQVSRDQRKPCNDSFTAKDSVTRKKLSWRKYRAARRRKGLGRDGMKRVIL